MQNKPSRPTRVKAKKSALPKVSKPDTLNTDVAKPTQIQAKALIGADPDLVTTVGLGNLKVTTAQGIKNDRNTDV
tara:strand:+ start:13 stop:237 length:225 start_codon:yes stop_codon:yes gene_type:complete